MTGIYYSSYIRLCLLSNSNPSKVKHTHHHHFNSILSHRFEIKLWSVISVHPTFHYKVVNLIILLYIFFTNSMTFFHMKIYLVFQNSCQRLKSSFICILWLCSLIIFQSRFFNWFLAAKRWIFEFGDFQIFSILWRNFYAFS